MAGKAVLPIRELATLYSLLTAYRDASGKRRVASEEGMLQVLQALGVGVTSNRDVQAALKRRRKEICSRPIEPVVVAWNGRLNVGLNLSSRAPESIDYELALEDGDVLSGRSKLTEVGKAMSESEMTATDLSARPTHRIRLSRHLPFGYHDLRLTFGREVLQTRVISAPQQCYSAPGAERTWGVFLPIYALASKRSWGAGDFTDFSGLIEFIRSRGGSVVATLPLLATFLGPGPFEPSPYSPASRLFWNEFYVDPTRTPEFEQSSRARQLVESPEFQRELAELRKQTFVDYRRQMAFKGRVLEELARTFFKSKPENRNRQFEEFLATEPALKDYAAFRAATERQERGWPVWPEPMREGRLTADDYDQSRQQYHMYAQWVATEQLKTLATDARAAGRGLYLDFPLGVHPDGYDIWRERNSFATGVSVGAPPDPFFTKGQDWGFPPMHPERLRQDGYRYFIRVLQHHLRFAGILRLDHVMALHRLYWIPRATEADQGVYVKYPAEELYAVLTTESHRHRTMIVGEDLGTVPAYVRTSMTRFNLRRMFVLQYEARSDGQPAINPVPEGSIASLNTHDMPPFAAFWAADDVDSRVEMGLLTEEEAADVRASRGKTRQAVVNFLQKRGVLNIATEDPVQVHDACMTYLGRSKAEVVLVNLEDLWLERQPQNTPGTSGEKPNWRRRARKSLEEIRSSPSVTLRLKAIDLQRR